MDLPLPPDFKEFLALLNSEKIEYLVVGGYAVSYYGYPRPTGDLDVWVEPSPENAARVMLALADFGASLDQVTAQDFSRPGIVFQMGLPPGRIDVLTELTGVTFAEAWPSRLRAPFGPVGVDFLGRETFIKNKRATGRVKDLGDIESLDVSN